MGLTDLKNDLLTKQDHPKDLDVSIQLDYEFLRANPVTALNAVLKKNRTLEYDYFNDCTTGKELAEFANFECGTIRDKSMSTTMYFT